MKIPLRISTSLFSFMPLILFAAGEADQQARQTPNSGDTGWAEIRVIDAQTERGVPLVELETVNGLRLVTDNTGRIALCEPGWIGREIFFSIRSHGYAGPKDGFGIVGARVTPTVGRPVEIPIERRIVAERLCRLTGEGLYRDTLLLGYQPPLADSPHPGQVAGQDSIQAAVYNGKVYCFWGDTQRMSYPLGLFRVAGATITIPNPNAPQSDPANGIPYDYFVDPQSGFARAMMPLPERPEGVIWVESVFVTQDASSRERLVGHYTRRKGLSETYEQGIAVYNDQREIFESARELPLDEEWRRPNGHPILHKAEGREWWLFGSPCPNVRVPATLADVLDPTKYESFTCAKPAVAGTGIEPDLGTDGRPRWHWRQDLPPTDSKQEEAWIKAGKLRSEHARFCPADAATPSKRIQLHRGTVRWNAFRQKWVLVAGQIGGDASFLGEVWYSEADEPTGPFTKAVKVVTHDRQTFYNVCHHPFLDRERGRVIHFEGTYTSDFSGNPDQTPRYNYNQILYRLDLGDPRLQPARSTATHTP